MTVATHGEKKSTSRSSTPELAARLTRTAVLTLGYMGSLFLATANAQSNDEPELTEVIVTARFREENLQETPLAITAVSGERLEEQGLTKLTNLGLVVPNANIRSQGALSGPNPLIGLRGVNTGDFIYTSEPGVAVYVDDVYHGTMTGSNMDLLDLERVEVLRGPQGTLFGESARFQGHVRSGSDSRSAVMVLDTNVGMRRHPRADQINFILAHALE